MDKILRATFTFLVFASMLPRLLGNADYTIWLAGAKTATPGSGVTGVPLRQAGVVLHHMAQPAIVRGRWSMDEPVFWSA